MFDGENQQISINLAQTLQKCLIPEYCVDIDFHIWLCKLDHTTIISYLVIVYYPVMTLTKK